MSVAVRHFFLLFISYSVSHMYCNPTPTHEKNFGKAIDKSNVKDVLYIHKKLNTEGK